jgi:uncharacterized protein (DUF2235 family)
VPGRFDGKEYSVFFDGTGHAGGHRPDQRLSNVYKLYRATRTEPDSQINPVQQSPFTIRASDLPRSKVRPGRAHFADAKIPQLSLRGVTKNVADCYEWILSIYEPGDRIFLSGFSRGAYAVPSVAGVMNLCGVPIKDAAGNPIPRWGRALRAMVDDAVRYQ